jgi:hypothetical protein
LLAGLGALVLSAVAFAVLNKPGMLILTTASFMVLGGTSLRSPNACRALAVLAWGGFLIVWFVWLTRDWSQYASSAVAHSAGGATVGFALTRSDFRRSVSPRARYSAILLAVAVIGVGWELVEFLSDRVFGTGLSGGSLDTALDLAWDVLGALICLVIAHARGQHRTVSALPHASGA